MPKWAGGELGRSRHASPAGICRLAVPRRFTAVTVWSKVEDHIQTDCQCVRDGLDAARVDQILHARLHEQARSNSAPVRYLQGHFPALHSDGWVRQRLRLFRIPKVGAVRAVDDPQTVKVAGRLCRRP
jgi:hypothetical protein